MSQYSRILDLWKSRPVFDTPEQLLRAAVGYFEWNDDNPLEEEHLFNYKGSVIRADKNLKRALTKRGLASHLGVTVSYVNKHRERGEDWEEVLEFIDQVIYTQKFEGAAANLFNSGIVSKDLGLAEKHEVSGPDGGPVHTVTSDMTPEEAAEAYEATLYPDKE